MRPTIVLFDVDGTLLSAGGAGRRALERAFAAHCGTSAPLHELRFNGMTDPGIVRAGLEQLGRSVEPRLVAAILDGYLALLGEELERAAGFTVHPGVTALLDDLAGDRRIALGLGTGNLRDGARLKVERAGLAAYFPFGGFGSDHEDRAELLRIGAARGAERLEEPLEGCRVVVVGDTPLDIAAAVAIGAASLGVATGGFKPDALRAAGATWAVEDLTASAAHEAFREGERA